MSICQSCGGVIGRDCFNPAECMDITRAQAECYQSQGDVQGELSHLRERVKELETKISEVQDAKKKAIEEQRFEDAGRLRDQERQLLEEKTAKEADIKAQGINLFDEVDEEAIAEVLSIWTGIPVYKLTEEETAKLLNMEAELHKRVIGQESAIKAVSQAIRRTRAGLAHISGAFSRYGLTTVHHQGGDLAAIHRQQQEIEELRFEAHRPGGKHGQSCDETGEQDQWHQPAG